MLKGPTTDHIVFWGPGANSVTMMLHEMMCDDCT